MAKNKTNVYGDPSIQHVILTRAETRGLLDGYPESPVPVPADRRVIDCVAASLASAMGTANAHTIAAAIARLPREKIEAIRALIP